MQNLEAWQAASAAIKDIEPHPNLPPTSAAHPQLAKLSTDIPEATASLASASTPVMGMGGLRDEIERVEAANVPLPLPKDDTGNGATSGDGGGASDNPLGPL